MSLPIGVIACLAVSGAAVPDRSPEFLRYWKSGMAELSVYDVKEDRYGEIRAAQAVLVFVYEETDAGSRIKVESGKTPSERRVPTLKLNRILKFNTGVYDYSVMTSVFAGLSGPHVRRAYEPLKISMSSQEWCGNVYHQLIPRGKYATEELHSYFEAEGDRRDSLALPGEGFYSEDEFPILLRELDGDWLAPGNSKPLKLVPALWRLRKAHKPLALLDARISKGGFEEFIALGSKRGVVVWNVELAGEKWRYLVEKEFPRRLLAWSNSKGESGTLSKSLRKPYWELNHNRDSGLRKELGLKFGVDE